jgi:hypothetical protein
MIPGSAIPLLLATAGPTFNPREYMDVKLYTGNGSTQTISGLGFSPDLVWIKNRASTYGHIITDIVRGADKQLYPYATNAESTEATAVTSFNSDGFSLGSWAPVNVSSDAHVAWCWDAGSSTVTNTVGSISSQVRANASAGFSVVSWSANNTANQSIGHGLGVTPAFIIHKNRTTSGNWNCWFTGFSNDEYINLNDTGAKASTGGGLWYQTPTSSVFYIGFTGSAINNSTNAIISYCFAPVAGYSSFGSYTGNGSATGPVISGLGFQPYFVIIKASSTTGDWWMYDGARSPSNPRINKLKANTSDVEDTAGEDVDFQSDGFQIKTSDSGLNQNAATYIYAAFA